MSGASIILEGLNGFLLEHFLVFKFKVSNNQAEYETLIAGLELAKDMGTRRLICRTDSQLVVGQMNGDFQVKEDHLLKYYRRASALARSFERMEIRHIPREQTARADMLSKLSSNKEKGQLTTIIRQILLQPSVECHAITTSDTNDWRREIKELMRKQDEGQSLKPAETKKIARFVMIGDDMYKRGFSTPLLKCLAKDEGQYVMDEIHGGICGFHSSRRVLKGHILRAGYFWPTMEEDAKLFTQKCLRCHAHSIDKRAPPYALHTIVSPWPFS